MKTVEQQLNELGEQIRKQEPSKESYERGLVILKERVARERHTPLETTTSVWVRVTETIRVATSFGDSLAVMRSSAVALVFIVVLGGAGIYAGLEARTATPSNESLYTLKLALQKTQVAISLSDSGKAKTQVVILEQRVEEVGREIERTAEALDNDISGIEKALANAQLQAAVVKEHLTQLSDLEDTQKLAEQVAGVQKNIETYSIAASEVTEDVTEEIKEQIDPEIEELTNAISEITALAENTEEDADREVQEGLDFATEEAVDVIDENSTGEDILEEKTEDADNVMGGKGAEIESNENIPLEPESEVGTVQVKETPKITPEMDTFKVYIGN